MHTCLPEDPLDCLQLHEQRILDEDRKTLPAWLATSAVKGKAVGTLTNLPDSKDNMALHCELDRRSDQLRRFRPTKTGYLQRRRHIPLLHLLVKLLDDLVVWSSRAKGLFMDDAEASGSKAVLPCGVFGTRIRW